MCEASDERSEHAQCGLYSWTTGEHVLHLISMQIVGPSSTFFSLTFVLFCFDRALCINELLTLCSYLMYLSLWTNAELWVWFFRLWFVFLSSLFDFAFYGSCFAKAYFVDRSSPVCFKHPSQILFTRDSYTDMHLNIMYCTHLLYCNVFVC